ncbi:hypothetical protein [Actinomadura hibisca]|uniref:hypothetical protein n=1 Tax=Actinomadura hibisca TaxID=68565 RepID=UPI000834C79C|nr:hypothetical protein [Actinomadura hibisca]
MPAEPQTIAELFVKVGMGTLRGAVEWATARKRVEMYLADTEAIPEATAATLRRLYDELSDQERHSALANQRVQDILRSLGD